MCGYPSVTPFRRKAPCGNGLGCPPGCPGGPGYSSVKRCEVVRVWVNFLVNKDIREADGEQNFRSLSTRHRISRKNLHPFCAHTREIQQRLHHGPINVDACGQVRSVCVRACVRESECIDGGPAKLCIRLRKELAKQDGRVENKMEPAHTCGAPGGNCGGPRGGGKAPGGGICPGGGGGSAKGEAPGGGPLGGPPETPTTPMQGGGGGWIPP